MSEVENFEAWELKWEGKHVQRFWDWQGRSPAKASLYFSNLVGDAILDEVCRYTRLAGTIVDWGAGPGFLVEKLLVRGLDTFATDSSGASVELLTEKFRGRDHFLGAQVSPSKEIEAKSSFADVIFLIETVEHLDDTFLGNVLADVYRVLKPGGTIIVTTPNQEILEQSQTMCPSCGCVFHTVQHVRTLTSNALHEIMSNAGFRKVVCSPTLFSWHRPILRQFYRLKYTLMREVLPHLLYIGRK